MTAAARKAALFVVAVALAAGVWELYKAFGPVGGGDVLGWRVLPKAGDKEMPHVVDIVQRLFDDESRTSTRPVLITVLLAAWYSFRLAVAAFAIGAAVGIGLAMVMSRFDVLRRASLPYLVISQTVPLIALAPIVISWSGRLRPFGWELPRWSAVVILGAFLAFFPIAVGTLRGLQSTSATALELMRSYAAGWRKTMFALRFPAAVPYLVPALRLGASAAVIGVVVSEISIGNGGGIGRLIITYAQQATSDETKVFTAVVGACLLGLVMAGLVAGADSLLMRTRARPADEG